VSVAQEIVSNRAPEQCACEQPKEPYSERLHGLSVVRSHLRHIEVTFRGSEQVGTLWLTKGYPVAAFFRRKNLWPIVSDGVTAQETNGCEALQ
jgi:hypothetical protein